MLLLYNGSTMVTSCPGDADARCDDRDAAAWWVSCRGLEGPRGLGPERAGVARRERRAGGWRGGTATWCVPSRGIDMAEINLGVHARSEHTLARSAGQ